MNKNSIISDIFRPINKKDLQSVIGSFDKLLAKKFAKYTN